MFEKRKKTGKRSLKNTADERKTVLNKDGDIQKERERKEAIERQRKRGRKIEKRVNRQRGGQRES